MDDPFSDALGLLLVFLNLALAAAVLLVFSRYTRIFAWIALAALYFFLRSLDRLMTDILQSPSAEIEVAVETSLAATLVLMLFGCRRLAKTLSLERRTAKQAQKHAQQAAHEYERALFDYTQLARHRLVNPLTAITAGLDTLYDLDLDTLDRETRCAIISAMRDKSRELQDIILDPSRISREELQVGLRPLPEESSEAMFKVKAAETEMAFRDLNLRRLSDLQAASGKRQVEFICECSSDTCLSPVVMPLDEYFRVHEKRNRFIQLPGHDIKALERIIEEHDSWVVAQKIDEGKERVEAHPSPASPDANPASPDRTDDTL